MKKIMTLAAIAAMSLVVSCSGNGPEGVTEKFVVHSSKGEFAEAKKYSTESTSALLSMAEGFAGDKIKEMKEKNKDVKVEIVSSEEKDTTATVKYKVTGLADSSGDESERSLDLVKRDGEWKVNINKENPAGSAAPAQ